MDRDGLMAALRKESEEGHPEKRMRAFAALLARESGLGEDGLTVVGGSALEIYTEGDYTSQDIDLLVEDRERAESVLRRWGFVRDGMYWVGSPMKESIQIVGRYDSGSPSHNTFVMTMYGRLRLGSMEDLIWHRLYEARAPGWKGPPALAEAKLLSHRYHGQLDWPYILKKASENGVEDLALELYHERVGWSTTTD